MSAPNATILIPAPKKALAEIALTSQGLVSESFGRAQINSGGGVTRTSGDVIGALLPFRAGTVVTNCLTVVKTGGTGITHAQWGIYNTSGTLLASSGDSAGDRTAFQSAGLVSVALSSTWTVPSDGGYYVALWVTQSAGTMPTIYSSVPGGDTNITGAVTGGNRIAVLQTGQASLPSPLTISSASTVLWIGCS